MEQPFTLVFRHTTATIIINRKSIAKALPNEYLCCVFVAAYFVHTTTCSTLVIKNFCRNTPLLKRIMAVRLESPDYMASSGNEDIAGERSKIFAYRLDFYWHAIALYAVALLIYALLKGSIVSGSLTIALYDPVVLVLGAVVIGSATFSLVNWYMQRSVEVGETFIRFRNRFRTRTISYRDVLWLSVGKQKLTRMSGAYHMVKIRLAQRRRLLRIRPSLYENDAELVQMFIALKRRIAEERSKQRE
jgi:hypothetical protein